MFQLVPCPIYTVYEYHIIIIHVFIYIYISMIYSISSFCCSLKWQSQYVNKSLCLWFFFKVIFQSWFVILIISWSISYIQVQNIVAAMSQRGMHWSNCYKIHPDTDSGPCSHCGQEDISKRYVHLVQKKLDSIECYDFVEKTNNISDFSCICRKCERKFNIFFRDYQKKMI